MSQRYINLSRNSTTTSTVFNHTTHISHSSFSSSSTPRVPHTMTRTERATSPRAIIKDRSESRSGMDKRTPKGGAGTHNWGSLMNERDYEDAALYDEENEEEQAEGESALLMLEIRSLKQVGVVRIAPPPTAAGTRRLSSNSVTEDDRKEALKVRKNALKSKGTPLHQLFFRSDPDYCLQTSTSPPSLAAPPLCLLPLPPLYPSSATPM